MLYLASQSSLVTPPDLLARYEAFLTECGRQRPAPCPPLGASRSRGAGKVR